MLRWILVLALAGSLGGCKGCSDEHSVSGLDVVAETIDASRPDGDGTAPDVRPDVAEPAQDVSRPEPEIDDSGAEPDRAEPVADQAEAEAAPDVASPDAAEPAPDVPAPDISDVQGVDTCPNPECATTKLVPCHEASPAHAHALVEPVTVTWTAGSGWSEPTDCAWACDVDFALDAGVCLHEKTVDCRDVAPLRARSLPQLVTITFTTAGGWSEPAPCDWECDVDAALVDGLCLDHQSVPCREAAPAHASSVATEVTITYTATDGWSEPEACDWTCDVDHVEADGACVHEKLVACLDRAPWYCDAVPGQVTITYTTATGWSTPSECAYACRNREPVVDALEPRTVPEGAPLQVTVTASDPDGDALSLRASLLPPGATFDPQDRVFAWTPGFEQAGAWRVRFTARDEAGAEGFADLHVVVTDVNRPPVVTAVPTVGAEAWAPWQGVVTAEDPDRDPLTFSLLEAPPCLKLDAATGQLAWTPSPAHEGTHAVRVEVEDGRGGTVEAAWTLSVAPAGADRLPPRVRLVAPGRVRAGGVLHVAALAADDDAVTSVTFALDGVEVSTLQLPPYRLAYNVAPDAAGVDVRVTVVDGAGNRAEATARVGATNEVDADPPLVAPIRAPSGAAPGETITLDVTADDPSGVVRVAFVGSDGQARDVDELPPFRGALQVPADAQPGSTFAFAVEAIDAEGNVATAPGSLTIVAEPDITAPAAATLLAPEQVLPGDRVVVAAGVDRPDEIGGLQLLVNGVPADDDATPPFGLTLLVPEGTPVGAVLYLSVVATDFSGNATPGATSCVPVVAPRRGFLAGEVFDDDTGLPLIGVPASLALERGRPPAQAVQVLSDARGRFRIEAEEGEALVLLGDAGLTTAWRSATVAGDAIATLEDTRLTRLAAPTEVSALTGALLSSPTGDLTLDVPAGALAVDAAVGLDRRGAQALPWPLPVGFSPRSAACVSPTDVAFGAPATLRLAIDAPGADDLLTLRFDATDRTWVRVAADVDAGGVVSLPIRGAGTWVVARPDAAPIAPVVPAISEPLASPLPPQSVPADATLRLEARPEVLFLRPGATADVALDLANPQPISSGARLVVEREEVQALVGGGYRWPSASTQDVTLFQSPEGLGASVRLASEASSTAADVLEATLTLTARALGENGTAVLSPSDQTLVTLGGFSLVVPPGAVASPRPVELAPVSPGALDAVRDALADLHVEVLAGLDVDLGSPDLARSAALVWTPATPLPSDARVLAVRELAIAGGTRYQAVGLAVRQGGQLAFPPDALDLPWPGVTGSGRYVLLRFLEPLGFAAGAVQLDGQPAVPAAVTLADAPFASLTREGQAVYLVPLTLGDHRLEGSSLAANARAVAYAHVAAADDAVLQDLALVPVVPGVASLSPADGATGVPTTASVTVSFTVPMDAATLDTGSFTLVGDDGGAVDARLSVASDGASAVLQPASPLASDAAWRVRLASSLRDRYGTALRGNRPDGSFEATFWTQDTTPPPLPAPGQLSFGAPDESGRVTLEGSRGALPPGTVVYVRNERTGVITTVLVGLDGSFSVTVEAGLADVLTLVAVDDAGNEVVLGSERPTPQPGHGLLGPEGGAVREVDGFGALVPAGVLPPDTEVAVSPIDVSALPSPLPPELPGGLVAGVRLDMGDTEIPDVTWLSVSVDGTEAFTRLDRTPLFEIDQAMPVPDDLGVGTVLHLSAVAHDDFGHETALEADIPVVAAADATPRVQRDDATPVLSLTVPTSVEPGGTLAVIARAEPPDIKLRFPAPESATANDQFLLVEPIENADGSIFYDLVTTGTLVTNADGSRTVQTNSPPYRGPRRTTGKLALAICQNLTLSYALVALNGVGGIAGAASNPNKVAKGFNAFGEDLLNVASEVAFGMSILRAYAHPSPADVGDYEMGVIPVPGGRPATIRLVDADTNRVLLTTTLAPIPPGHMSGVVLLGEDENDPVVTDTNSFAGHAVPTQPTLSLAFSHVLDTATVNAASLYLEDDQHKKIDAIIGFPAEAAEAYRVSIRSNQLLQRDHYYKLKATSAIQRPNAKALSGAPFEWEFKVGHVGDSLWDQPTAGVGDFDRLGNLGVLAISKANGFNGLRVLDLSDPAAASVRGEVFLEPTLYGPVRHVRLVQTSGYGPVAVLTAGSVTHWGRLLYIGLSDPANPTRLNHTMVSTPKGVLDTCEAIEVVNVTLDNADIEVYDPCPKGQAMLDGIPKIAAIPSFLDVLSPSPDKQSVYFVDVGLGILSVDLGRALAAPAGDHDARAAAFGPSAPPDDKTGGMIYVPPATPATPRETPQLKLTAPAEASTCNGAVDVAGQVLDAAVDRVLVNGFEAEIAPAAPPATQRTFSIRVPVLEGAQALYATPFTGSSAGDPALVTVLRPFAANPLQGASTLTSTVPGLATGGASYSVTATALDKVLFDRVYANGKLLSQKACNFVDTHPEKSACNWNGTGTGSVSLLEGLNSVVATTIDVDGQPNLRSFSDLRALEGLVAGIGSGGDTEIGALILYDASSMLRVGKVGTPDLDNGFRVSLFPRVPVDIDLDTRRGFAENDDTDQVDPAVDLDGDGTYTVQDEVRNLALVGTGNRDGGVLYFVDVTLPWRPHVLGKILNLGEAYNAVPGADGTSAFVATGGGVAEIDLTRPTLVAASGQPDTRVLWSTTVEGGQVQDVRLDPGTGQLFVFQKNVGVRALNVAGCDRDPAIDLTRTPVAQELRPAKLEYERSDLLEAIHKGFTTCPGLTLGSNAALLSQGSSACIWSTDGRCPPAYKPGLSDYDFELLVPSADLAAATACAKSLTEATKDASSLTHHSVFADVTFFPESVEAFRNAYRPVTRGANGECGGEGDLVGDGCLGRNGLMLKWVLEGEWVRDGGTVYNVVGGTTLDLEAIRQTLAAPMSHTTHPTIIVDQAGSEPYVEPSHIPRLEGLEWGQLQDYALQASGAPVRILGDGLGDVPVVNPFFTKKLHKAAKAGIRAVFGRLVADDTGNALVLLNRRGDYRSERGCFTKAADPDHVTAGNLATALSWKRCESFEEYVASCAVLAAVRHLKTRAGADVITGQQASDAYWMFRIKGGVGHPPVSELEANRFIAMVATFIRDLRSDAVVKKTYDDDSQHYADKATRDGNRTAIDLHRDKVKPGGTESELLVPARLRNGGFGDVKELEAALFHDGSEINRRVFESISAGEALYFKGKSGALQYFKVKPVKPGLRTLRPVYVGLDPEAKVTEPDERNNVDGFYYYVLDPDNPAPPSVPSTGIRPKASGALATAAVAKACKVNNAEPPSPSMQLIATVDQRYDTTVEPGAAVPLTYVVRNTGNVALQDFALASTLPPTPPQPGGLAPGASVTLTGTYTAPGQDGLVIGLDTLKAKYLDPSGKAINAGVVSTAVMVNVAKPLSGPVVRILNPPRVEDPENPFVDWPYQTPRDSLEVAGVVETDTALGDVKVNGQATDLTGAPPLYTWKTSQPLAITTSAVDLSTLQRNGLGAGQAMDVTAVATDAKGMKAQDQRQVVRVKTTNGLQVTSLVNGRGMYKANPGETVTYTAIVRNDSAIDLKKVSVLELLADQLSPSFHPDEFALAAGAEKTFTYTFATPTESQFIVNEVVAEGVDDSGNGIGPARDSAELWVGKLVLRPRLIVPLDLGARVQLHTNLTADGADVTSKATGTTYEVVLKNGSLGTAAIQAAVNEILARIKDENGQPIGATLKITDATIDARGVLTVKGEGFNVIQAKHTSERTGNQEVVSNYALIVAGLEWGKLSEIEIAPHSLLTDLLVAPWSPGVLLYETLSKKFRGWLGQVPAADKPTDDDRNVPMVLAKAGALTCVAGVVGAADDWLTSHGYAELVSIKFDFLGGAISGVDLLAGARKLLGYIPSPRPLGIPIPVGWLLGKALNFTLTQFVSFESDTPAVVTISNSFPTGVASAVASGLATITGTLDLGSAGSAKDDVAVIVLPSLSAADVRPDQNEVAVGGTVDLHTLATVEMIQPPDGQGNQQALYTRAIPDLSKYVKATGSAQNLMLRYGLKYLPGVLSWTLGWNEIVDVVPIDNEHVKLRLRLRVSNNKIEIFGVSIGFRTPNALTTYTSDAGQIASPALLASPLSFERTWKGHAAGTAHATARTCIPLLGTATDAYDAATGTGGATIHVAASPIARADAADTDEGVPVTIPALQNDLGADGQPAQPPAVVILGLTAPTFTPASGNAGAAGGCPATVDGALAGAGILFTPPAASNCFGDYAFDYTLKDTQGRTSAPARVTVHVNGVPVAAAVTETVNVGTTLHVAAALLGEDPDPEASPPVTIVWDGPDPANPIPATLPSVAWPEVTFTPSNASGANGLYRFDFRLQDPHGATSATSTLTIDVNGPPEPQATFLRLTEGTSLPLAATSLATDPDNDRVDVAALHLRSYTDPWGGSDPACDLAFTPSSGASLTLTAPSAPCFGDYVYDVELEDEHGLAGTAPAELTVHVNALPVALDVHRDVNEGDPPLLDLVVPALGDDPDGVARVVDVVAISRPLACPADLAWYQPSDDQLVVLPPSFGSDCQGEHVFEFVLEDDASPTPARSQAARVTVVVNALPAAQDQELLGTPGVAMGLDLAALGADRDGSIVAAAVVSAPLNGVATGGAYGLVYTSLPLRCGLDSFTFTLLDDRGAASPPATVQVHVTWQSGVVINELELQQRWIEVANRTVDQVDVTGWKVGGKPLGVDKLWSGETAVVSFPDGLPDVVTLTDATGAVRDTLDTHLACCENCGASLADAPALSLRPCGHVTGDPCADYIRLPRATRGELFPQ